MGILPLLAAIIAAGCGVRAQDERQAVGIQSADAVTDFRSQGNDVQQLEAVAITNEIVTEDSSVTDDRSTTKVGVDLPVETTGANLLDTTNVALNCESKLNWGGTMFTLQCYAMVIKPDGSSVRAGGLADGVLVRWSKAIVNDIDLEILWQRCTTSSSGLEQKCLVASKSPLDPRKIDQNLGVALTVRQEVKIVTVKHSPQSSSARAGRSALSGCVFNATMASRLVCVWTGRESGDWFAKGNWQNCPTVSNVPDCNSDVSIDPAAVHQPVVAAHADLHAFAPGAGGGTVSFAENAILDIYSNTVAVGQSVRFAASELTCASCMVRPIGTEFRVAGNATLELGKGVNLHFRGVNQAMFIGSEVSSGHFVAYGEPDEMAVWPRISGIGPGFGRVNVLGPEETPSTIDINGLVFDRTPEEASDKMFNFGVGSKIISFLSVILTRPEMDSE